VWAPVLVQEDVVLDEEVAEVVVLAWVLAKALG
jgi:hypothetical protein